MGGSKHITEVVIIGRGAIGVLYCAALVGAGIRVRVVADPARIERYGGEELIFNGEVVRGLEYVAIGKNDSTAHTPAELIIIATKWQGFHSALEMASGFMGVTTLIMPLLNGILPHLLAAERFGRNKALQAFYIGTTASRTGNSTTMQGRYQTVMEPNAAVEKLFDHCRISYRTAPDMEHERWQKMVINCGFNQTSALCGGLTYGQIAESAEMLELCRGLMAETATIARLLGVNNTETMTPKAMETLKILDPTHYTSMAQDIRANRATEWPIFGGFLLGKAQELGVSLPYHTKIKGLI